MSVTVHLALLQVLFEGAAAWGLQLSVLDSTTSPTAYNGQSQYRNPAQQARRSRGKKFLKTIGWL